MEGTADRPRRQLKQPTKGTLRETLARAADTIAAKNAEIDRLAAQLMGEGKAFGAGLLVGIFATVLTWAVGA